MKNRMMAGLVACLSVLAIVLVACSSAPALVPALEPEPTPVLTPDPVPVPDPAPILLPAIRQFHSINETLSLSLVIVDEEVIVAGDGEVIVLINNKNAQNPTYGELKGFLNNDWTDLCFYNDLPDFRPGGIGLFLAGDLWDTVDLDYYMSWAELGKTEISAFSRDGRFHLMVCSDFAEILHNNAELQGIRAAYVIVAFESGDPHTMNAFETLDRGLVFVDSTGEGIQAAQEYWSEELLFEKWLNSWDKIANVEVGEPLTFSSVKGYRDWHSMGIVREIDIQWFVE